jgi:hypothetical protein
VQNLRVDDKGSVSERCLKLASSGYPFTNVPQSLTVVQDSLSCGRHKTREGGGIKVDGGGH